MIASVNGVPCAYLQVIRQRMGSAVLSAVLSEQVTLDQDITASISGVTVFTGTLHRGGQERGLPKLIAHDGVPLRQTLPAKYYQDADRTLIGRDILTATGLQGDVQLPGLVARYARRKAPAREQLADLLEGTGALWRTLPDGRVFIGREQWTPHPAVKWQEDFTGYQPEQGLLRLLPTPTLLPGMTLPADPDEDVQEFRISRVEHLVSGQQLVTHAWT